ncbi:hypothetical protein GH714_021284 [Hevea brasiliensis]|uniref:Protein kinase domain-containing protein n=1 Tax=Hevea brasiliensis TaxID=3981 RepID=A0A6A6LDW7_HEVBR|nr:hypothetical protein GH714_021284 [Hevea brasiliensis]
MQSTSSKEIDYSFKSGFAIGYVVFSVSVATVYASYCVPWVNVGKRNKMITVAAMVMLMIKRSKRKRTEVDQLGSMSTMEFLLETQEDKKKILGWPLRVKIAVGLARGMAWLHHGDNFRVAHLNVSAKSILLDQKFEPKLSNFGKAMLINPNEINSSCSFSMDIEFWEQCYLKEDVFNFGIVLLELITGKKATSLNNSDDGSLDKWISALFSSSFCLYDAIDNPIIGQGHDGEIFELLRVAYECIQRVPEQRPSMLDVYKTISNIGERYYLADNSEIAEQTEII